MDESLLLGFADSEETHWWFVVRRRIVEAAIAAAGLPADARVLEVGCGTGGFARHIATAHPGWRVTGIEPSGAAVAVATSRGCDVNEGTFESLAAVDGSVDLLVALDVLEHCEDDLAAAREAVRVLAPGGVFVMTVPALPSLWSQHDVDNAHFRRYTRPRLRELLGRAGLEVERSTYFNSLLLPAAYVSRWVARVTGSRKALGVDTPATPVNETMKAVFSIEVALLKRSDLPVGMSLLAVAKKR